MKLARCLGDGNDVRGPAAFNLIEMLVVIVLISIMAALLLPAISKAKQQSAAASCLNNQKQLAAALHMYTEDNADRIVQMSDYDTGEPIFPAGGFWGGPMPGISAWKDRQTASAAVQTGLSSSNAFYFYCGNLAVYHCPADSRVQAAPAPDSPNGWGYDSYARTQNMGGEPFGNYCGAGATYTKMSAIQRPSQTFSMMEAADWRGYDEGTWQVQWMGQNFQWVQPPAIWHVNVSSAGFADGHAELYRWTDSGLISAGKTAGQGLNPSRWNGPTDGADYNFIYSHYLFPGHP